MKLKGNNKHKVREILYSSHFSATTTTNYCWRVFFHAKYWVWRWLHFNIFCTWKIHFHRIAVAFTFSRKLMHCICSNSNSKQFTLNVYVKKSWYFFGDCTISNVHNFCRTNRTSRCLKSKTRKKLNCNRLNSMNELNRKFQLLIKLFNSYNVKWNFEVKCTWLQTYNLQS